MLIFSSLPARKSPILIKLSTASLINSASISIILRRNSCESAVGERVHHRLRGCSLGRIGMIADQLLERQPRVDAVVHLDERLRFAQQRRAGKTAPRKAH